MEVVLTRTASLATGEGTLVVALACMDAYVTGEMAASGEGAFACRTDVFADGLGVGELRVGQRWRLRVDRGMKRGRQGRWRERRVGRGNRGGVGVASESRLETRWMVYVARHQEAGRVG